MDAANERHYRVLDLDPFIIRFTDTIGIRWYGLAYVAAIVVAMLMLTRWAKRGRLPLAKTEVQDFAFWTGLCMILGGRLGYCLFYGLGSVLRNPLFIIGFAPGFHWEGLSGMSSHGGIIGLFVGAVTYARSRKRSLPVLCDAICAVAPIGVMFGRIANFINGELWGRITDVPWAMRFPNEIEPSAYGKFFPVDAPMSVIHAWQVAHAELAPPRHPSQLYATVLEGLIPLLIVMPLHARHRRPGLTAGILMILYSIGRFVDEFFREPDVGQPGSPGIPGYLGWMSKGQALTLPLLAIGILVAVWALRRPAKPEAYVAPPQPLEST